MVINIITLHYQSLDHSVIPVSCGAIFNQSPSYKPDQRAMNLLFILLKLEIIHQFFINFLKSSNKINCWRDETGDAPYKFILQGLVFLWILQHWFVLNIWVGWREILQILLFMATNMTDISWGGLILKFKLENFPFLIKIYLFRASNFSKMLHNPENPLIIKWNLFILSSSLPNFNQDVSARPGRQMSTPCRNQGGTFCQK